jgi:hypothetical protein
MKGTSAAAFGLLMMSVVPASLSAKGNTVKITIKGAGLTTPLEITDPEIGQFQVWAGLGTFKNSVEGTEGFIIDWSKGIVAERPIGVQHYEVSLYSGCQIGEWGCRTSKPSLCYVVFYDYDPSMEQGYIYLPGEADELFKFNTRMWHGHGFEGNWSRATRAWENFVRPLIAKARAAGPIR